MRKTTNKKIIITTIIIIILLLLLKNCDFEITRGTSVIKESTKKFMNSHLSVTEFEELTITSYYEEADMEEEECIDDCEWMWWTCNDFCTEVVCEDYDGCLTECDGIDYEEEFSTPPIIRLIEIIPSAYAIAPGMPFPDLCYDDCEDDYWGSCEDCFDSCNEEADVCVYGCIMGFPEESYYWNEEPITNIGIFYEEAFPNFYNNSQRNCENWLHTGTWISTSEEIGCVEPRWVFGPPCDNEAIISAGEVCETIGGTYTCNEEKVTCKII